MYVFIYCNSYSQTVASLNNSSYTKITNTDKLSNFNFEVYNFIPEEIKNVTEEMAGSHFLGEDIAKKVYLFEQAYTYTVAISPGNPSTRTMFRKPVVYNSVRKIEHYLKKSVKKGLLTIEEARNDFNKVLDVALTTKSMNTNSFEDSIKSINDSSDLLTAYSQVNLHFSN